MWINKLFTDLASRDEQNCLTIDCSGANKNGLGRYGTKADNPEKQVCYFNEARNDQVYNVFISERIKSGNSEKSFYFKIDRVRSKANSETFSSKQKLERNGSGNERLSERDRGTELFEGGIGNGKDVKQFDKPKPRQSARPRFLSGQ